MKTNLALLTVLMAFPALSQAQELPKDVGAFLQTHCVRCHGPMKQSGNLRLDDLNGDTGPSIERWLTIRDQVRDGTMPPAKEARPNAEQAKKLVDWITQATRARAARLPNQGNLIPHELLFGEPAKPDAPAEGRLWRLSPDGYMGFVRGIGKVNTAGIIQPFSLVPERGIKDFAGLYTIDEPSTEILLRNSELIVDALSAHMITDGVVKGKNGSIREFVELMNPKLDPTAKQLETSVQKMFQLALGRSAQSTELSRFLGLHAKCSKLGDKPAAARAMLQAVLLRSDAMFRSELGQGSSDDSGRRMLSADELTRAISLALGDRRDNLIALAAQKGQLSTREQVAAHVKRMLGDAKMENPRILRFFQEYFEYGKAIDIFKERTPTHVHSPRQLVTDTDLLILHIVKTDKDVLRQLLTTELTFANHPKSTKPGTMPKPGVVVNPINNKGQKGPEFVYGFEAWPKEQPATLPKDQRLGILMQPSWLVSHGTNFDNDPVRRGRWIRERLLGGTVPDLPIGVVAQVPDDPEQTFRHRLQLTRAAQCWKCHRQMDDLGLPFEQFDHFGRFRTVEMVLDPEATKKTADKKGKTTPVLRPEKLDTTGLIARSGDANLDGAVRDPREFVRKLADSERVRQVFVRHAFRYFLGRNETLSDAHVLQEADRSFVKSGGSFKALVASLVTSDAFLYRSASTTTRVRGDSR